MGIEYRDREGHIGYDDTWRRTADLGIAPLAKRVYIYSRPVGRILCWTEGPEDAPIERYEAEIATDGLPWAQDDRVDFLTRGSFDDALADLLEHHECGGGRRTREENSRHGE